MYKMNLFILNFLIYILLVSGYQNKSVLLKHTIYFAWNYFVLIGISNIGPYKYFDLIRYQYGQYR